MRKLLALICAAAFCLAGCPGDGGDSGTDQNSKLQAGLNPKAPVPADSPYLEYAGLRLGMSALELAQVYNAPKGQGEGFTRVIEFYGDVHHHIIDFAAEEGREKRRIVASLYRDQLYLVIDDRDWMTLEHRNAWWDELLASYGGDYVAVLQSSQWSWGDKAGVLLTFTQDNATDNLMNGNVVLQHTPTWDAARKYLAYWEETHPEAFTDSAKPGA